MKLADARPGDWLRGKDGRELFVGITHHPPAPKCERTWQWLMGWGQHGPVCSLFHRSAPWAQEDGGPFVRIPGPQNAPAAAVEHDGYSFAALIGTVGVEVFRDGLAVTPEHDCLWRRKLRRLEFLGGAADGPQWVRDGGESEHVLPLLDLALAAVAARREVWRLARGHEERLAMCLEMAEETAARAEVAAKAAAYGPARFAAPEHAP